MSIDFLISFSEFFLDNTQSNLTIYAQLPQYMLMEFSELFIMLNSYKFAYFVAPRSAQSLFLSFYFCSIGISSFLSVAYTTIFSNTSSSLDFRVSKANDRFSSVRSFSVLQIFTRISSFWPVCNSFSSLFS